MSTIVVMMTDGRPQNMEPAMASISLRLYGDISRYIIHDDSGDPAYHRWLHDQYTDCFIMAPREGTGPTGAYSSIWQWLATLTTPETWVFQTSDDYTLHADLDLRQLAAVLDRNPHLAQMQLRRPARSKPETIFTDGTHCWSERRGWSTAPSIFPRDTCVRGWPARRVIRGIWGWPHETPIRKPRFSNLPFPEYVA